QAVIDPFEEARAIELDERLASGRRGGHSPQQLLTAATENGMAALGWKSGRLEAGMLADFIALDLLSPRTAGIDPEQLVFAATAAVFKSAFRIGQSAIASEPSLIDSVSLYGEATLPASRWSRPITIGALIRPEATSRLKARPALARAPWPSQQMRAGKPWKATC